MVTEQDKLAEDPEFAAAYSAAHHAYIADRDAHGHIDELDGISAGGMPSQSEMFARARRPQSRGRPRHQPCGG